ncbi:MAG: hypothetical protein ABSB67_09115 [Bryobacteraceae bacterium]|jgi:hypothetical protein
MSGMASPLRPDVIAEVWLYRTEDGGRKSPTPPDRWGCIFQHEGEDFDCRLLLAGRAIAPGDRANVAIKFLRPDLIKSRLAVGSRFKLREGRIIGEGVIDGILAGTDAL